MEITIFNTLVLIISLISFCYLTGKHLNDAIPSVNRYRTT